MTSKPFDNIFGKEGNPFGDLFGNLGDNKDWPKYNPAEKSTDKPEIDLAPYILEIKKYKAVSVALARMLAEKSVVPLEQNSDYWFIKAEKEIKNGSR